MSAMEVLAIIVSAGVGVLFVTLTGLWMLDERRRVRGLRRLRQRGWRAERAAFEASLEAPEFDPDAIRAAITAKLAADPAALAELPDGAALDRWRRRVEAMGASDVTRASVELLEVVNREGDDEDRVVAAVTTDVVSSRWTLVHTAGQWVASDITDAPVGDQALSAPLVPGPWADIARLHTESTLELAAADALHTDSLDRALIDTRRPPTDAVRDLGLVDPRFGFDVLDVVIGRLVDTWQGQPRQLTAFASREAATHLLHPQRAPQATTVVHDLTLTSWAPRALYADRPTRLDVFVELEGIRYVIVPDEAALLAGSQHVRHPLHLVWTLTLVTDPEIAWRLDATTDPAADLYWLP
jgi:hypothetical protein